MKLKSHFSGQDENISSTKEFRINKNSTWEPTHIHPNVSTFIDIVNKELKSVERKPIPRDNLSKLEREALKDLSQREDIIITKADKGGATVIWDVTDYIKEAYTQLNNSRFYRKLDLDPTFDFTETVKNTINTLLARGHITNKIAKQLLPDDIRTPKFYLLPKIHKPSNPGRPVISSINCHTSNISAYISHTIQPEVEKLDSYVKDTSDFLRKIDNFRIQDGGFLFTMDVRSLYTNIPHDEGKIAVEECLLREHPRNFVNAIISLLTLVLTLNNFEFNNENYLQILGCAMGTICAPPYANIFMGKFETDYIYPLFTGKCPLYLRFIDDIFGIWIGTKEEFTSAIESLNKRHHSIKFDFELSQSDINFLDTNVYVDKNNMLKTKVFSKPTDRHNFLHRRSEHPESLKKNIPYGQLLRGRRICTQTTDFEIYSNKLKESFRKRGYTDDDLKNHIERVHTVSREAALTQVQRPQNTRMVFVTTYNRTNPNIQSILLKHWNLLQIDPKLSEVFSQQPMIAFKRNKNLGNLLGSKYLSNSKVVRKKKHCIQKRCKPCTENISKKCCKQLRDTTTFKSSSTGKIFKIFHECDCQSKNIVYLMECTICNLQYIGKTQTQLERRINGHRSDVRCKKEPITSDEHFRLPDHNFDRDARFTIIEQAIVERDKGDMANFLMTIEDNWILRLKTLPGYGLNEKLNFPNRSTGILSI